MQCAAQPGNVPVYGSGNLPCFPACAHLADPIQLLPQEGVLSSRLALSYLPSDPEQAYKHLDTKCVVGHVG